MIAIDPPSTEVDPEDSASQVLSGAPVDERQWTEQFEGDLPLARFLTSTFSESLTSVVETLHALAKDHDHDQLGRVAHRIRGGALSVAALRIAEIASRIEAASTSAERDQIEALVYELGRERVRLAVWIAEHVTTERGER